MKLSSTVIAHFLLGQARRRGPENNLLLALCTAIQSRDEPLEHSSKLALQICEAAALNLGRKRSYKLVTAISEREVEFSNSLSHRLSAAVIAGDFEQVAAMTRVPFIAYATFENLYFGRVRAGQGSLTAAGKGRGSGRSCGRLPRE